MMAAIDLTKTRMTAATLATMFFVTVKKHATMFAEFKKKTATIVGAHVGAGMQNVLTNAAMMAR